jgi:hypothetical protein
MWWNGRFKNKDLIITGLIIWNLLLTFEFYDFKVTAEGRIKQAYREIYRNCEGLSILQGEAMHNLYKRKKEMGIFDVDNLF